MGSGCRYSLLCSLLNAYLTKYGSVEAADLRTGTRAKVAVLTAVTLKMNKHEPRVAPPPAGNALLVAGGTRRFVAHYVIRAVLQLALLK